MSVLNRRNAIAGWAAWKLTKAALQQKRRRQRRWPRALFAIGLALAAGVATFLRLRHSEGVE